MKITKTNLEVGSAIHNAFLTHHQRRYINASNSIQVDGQEFIDEVIYHMFILATFSLNKIFVVGKYYYGLFLIRNLGLADCVLATGFEKMERGSLNAKV